jgi:hypothetical protein
LAIKESKDIIATFSYRFALASERHLTDQHKRGSLFTIHFVLTISSRGTP